MKKLIVLALMFLALTSYAYTTYFLVVPEADVAALLARLDQITIHEPNTLHYTLAQSSYMATVTTKLIAIDDRAQAVLTPQEWAAKLATPPAVFIPPNPFGGQ